MASKFVVLIALVAAAQAVPPGGKYIYKTVEEEHHAPAVYDYHYSVEDHHTGDIKGLQESRKGHNFQGQYSLLEADGHHRRTVQYAGDEHSGFNADFSYAVEDHHTGDSKSQQESRKGDAVHGQYSLIDADGHRRTVEYSADDHSGFQAVVHREPVQGHQVRPAAPHHVAKVLAPVVHHHAVPVAYHAAPVAQHIVKTHAPAGVGHYSVSFSNPSISYHY